MAKAPSDIFLATAKLHDQTARGPEAGRFPLTLACAALALNGLGLSAAVLGVQWGAAPPRPEALGLAWVYVNECLAATWFLLWPAFALRATEEGGEGKDLRHGGPRGAGPFWDLPALMIAAIPAVGVAAWLSEVTPAMIVRMLALQLALAMFALGVLSRRQAQVGQHAVLAGILAGLLLAWPLIAYLQLEFYPAAGQAWHALGPALAVAAATDPAAPTGLWWVVVAYALAGGILLALPRNHEAR